MVHALAAAAVVASPLFGHTLGGQKTGEPSPAATSKTMVLNPRTLKPVPNSPRLPAGADAVEVSPDGTKVAAFSKTRIVIASLETGKQLGSIPVRPEQAAPGQTALAWLRDDRILVFTCTVSGDYFTADDCSASVQAVDPTTFQPIGEPRSLDGQPEIARSGEREVVALSRVAGEEDFETPNEDGGTPSLVVLDAEGAELKRFDFPALAAKLSLDGDLAAAALRDESGTMAYRVDAQALTLAAERKLPAVYDGGGVGPWMLPAPRGAALLRQQGKWRQLDRTTLATTGPSVSGNWPDVFALGAGVARRFGRKITASTLDGKRRWQTPVCTYFNQGAIGRYLYVTCLKGRGPKRYRYETLVISVKTGKTVRRVKDRFFLLAPSAGRFGLAVPVADGGSILASVDDDD